MTTAKKAYATKTRLDRHPLWKNGRPLLTWLDFELTERCNNSCVHCSINRPADDPDARGRELKTDEVKSLLAGAAALGCLSVRFTGGEPLLRDDFDEIYLSARKLGMRVMIFTNATLVTARLAALLSRIPPIEKVEVSVYGMRAGSYESVTNAPGSFEAARRGIAVLAEHRIPFIVKGALLPANKAEKKEFEDWAAGLQGPDRKPAWAMFFDFRSRRDTGKNALISRLRIPAAEAQDLTVRRVEDGGAELREFIARHAGVYGDRLFICFPGRGRGAVDAYGSFQYCLLLRHPETVFDLKRRSLQEILADHLPGLGAMRARNPEYLRRCGRCFLRAFCLQCPARSWSEHGTLDTPVDYLCGVTHAQAEALGFLEKGEKAWTVTGWQARVNPMAGTNLRGREEGRACREG